MSSSLAYAKTTDEIARIQDSAAYTGLSSAARAAFEAVPYSVQYLAACAAAGGSTYGRTPFSGR